MRLFFFILGYTIKLLYSTTDYTGKVIDTHCCTEGHLASCASCQNLSIVSIAI